MTAFHRPRLAAGLPALLVLPFLLAVPPTRAQSNPPPAALTLTLDQALAIAERSHPDLAESRALLRAADGRVQQAGARPNPEAILRLENAPFGGSLPDNADYLGGVGLTVPLGNRRQEAVRTEDLDRRRLGFEGDARRLELRRRVQGRFAMALYQDQARRLRAELADAAEHAARLARARVEVGDTIPSDPSRADIELAGARSELRRSDALQREALAALAAGIGLPAAAVQAVEGALDAALEVPTLEEVANALHAHPLLAAAEADVAARTANVALTRASRIPDLKAEVLYHRIGSQDRDALDVGISLPLPIFDRGWGRQIEASAQQDAAEARERSTRAQLLVQAREAHAQLVGALADLRMLRDEIVPKMAGIRAAHEARHAAGDLALAELLPVRRDDATARLRHLEALRDVLLAWTELHPFLGTDKGR